MKTISDLSYPIYIEDKDHKNFQTIFKNHVTHSRAFVVSDEHVWQLFSKQLKLMFGNVNIINCQIPAGETSKSLETFENTIETLIDKGIKRDDVLVAFGGGVVGDLVGYIASSLYRGIDFIQIPTTVIAQVDSSIGSKVGINLTKGKNLLGAFKDPLFVYTYVPFLSHLPEREFNNGMAEVIKAGAIMDPTILDDVLHNSFNVDVLIKAIQVKVEIVKQDKFESNLRMILNFGHTLGHAIEKANNYDVIKHGEAVSLGMQYALKLGEKMNITIPNASKKVLEALNKFQLLNHSIGSMKEYISYMKVDKKQREKGLEFVFIIEPGKAFIKTLKVDDLYVD